MVRNEGGDVKWLAGPNIGDGGELVLRGGVTWLGVQPDNGNPAGLRQR